MSYGYVYRYTNLINGKIYYGQTIRKKGRRETIHKYEAKKGSRFYFHNAIRKYGYENFKKEIVCECEDVLSLALIEDLCINLFSLYPLGYNLRRGGVHGKYSKKSKNPMSNSRKKYFKDLKNREKNSEAQKIAQNRQGVKKKKSKAMIKWYENKENKDYYLKQNDKKRKLTKKENLIKGKKISKSLKIYYENEEHRKDISRANFERFENENERLKISKTLKEIGKKKRKCEYCDKPFSILGIVNHEKACKKKNKKLGFK